METWARTRWSNDGGGGRTGWTNETRRRSVRQVARKMCEDGQDQFEMEAEGEVTEGGAEEIDGRENGSMLIAVV